MKFVKMHGLGNDFIIVERELAPERQAWASGTARMLCDRRRGIGADGLVFVSPVSDGIRMDIYNPDGSRAAMCGNASRCLGLYARDRGFVQSARFTLHTRSGAREIALLPGDLVRVDMGEPALAPDRIPALLPGERVLDAPLSVGDRTFSVSLVSMGNPHAVVRLDHSPAAFDLARYGPLLERHEAFPDRVNAEFLYVLARDHIEMRVWERGAGETQACGTGACACAVAGGLGGWLDARVRVDLPGGSLTIDYIPGGHVFMTGPAEYSFVGELPDEALDDA